MNDIKMEKVGEIYIAQIAAGTSVIYQQKEYYFWHQCNDHTSCLLKKHYPIYFVLGDPLIRAKISEVKVK